MKLVIQTQFWFRNRFCWKTCQMCILMLTIILSRKITGLTKVPLLYCRISILNVDLQNVSNRNSAILLWRIEECIKSSIYSLVWAHPRITKEKQRVLSWSGFYELAWKPDLDRIHRWVLTTLTFFTNKNESYCSRDHTNAGYHERTWNGFYFHWSYIHESTRWDVRIEK